MAERATPITMVGRTPWILMALMALLFSGCASYETGSELDDDWSEEAITITPKTLPKDAQRSLLVVLRYPVLVDEYVEWKIDERFGHWRPGHDEPDPEAFYDVPPSSGFSDSLRRTLYYANELYRILTQRLPEGSVIMLPQKVVRDGDGYRAVALERTTPPPAAVTVDFFTYTQARRDALNEDVLMSLGDMVTPMIQAHTAPAAAPETGGVLIRTEGMHPLIEKGGNHTIIDHMLLGSTDDSDLSLDNDVPADEDEVLEIPLESLQMEEERIQENAATPNPPPGLAPSYFAFISAYANAVVDAVNRIDIAKALQERRRDYEQNLISEIRKQSQGAPPSTRGDNWSTFVRRAERGEVISMLKRSAVLYSLVYQNSFGNGMRQTVKAEFDYIVRARDIADEQATNNFMTGVNIALAVAGAAAGVAASTQNLSAAQHMDLTTHMNTITTQTSSLSNTLMEERSALSAAQVANEATFNTSFNDVYFQQDLIISDAILTGGKEDLRVKDLKEAREKIAKKYIAAMSRMKR
ncbi:MAG: hypothetical protein HQL50_09015 [Magnetococcales bacterium]|nr:hypothetical protein [Magnetococcales bacterium]